MNPLLFFGPVEETPARQALAHNGLASHAQEWSREWQRAQARAWLHATPVPRVDEDPPHPRGGMPAGVPAADAVAGRPHAHAVAAAQVGLPPPQCFGTTAVAPASSPVFARASRIAPEAFLAPEASGQPGLAREARLPAKLAPSPREAIHPAPSPTHAHALDKDTLRLHVEQAADGLHVWIGVDGAGVPVAARAAAIVAELRRAEHVHGPAFASIVFNGRILYAAGALVPFHMEAPR